MQSHEAKHCSLGAVTRQGWWFTAIFHRPVSTFPQRETEPIDNRVCTTVNGLRPFAFLNKEESAQLAAYAVGQVVWGW